MMGRQRGDQDRLFYDVSLDGLVPADHLVRRIDAVLDLGWLRGDWHLIIAIRGAPPLIPS